MARTVRQISNLVIDEVSLVDKGANQHAVVTIAKSADGENKENEMDIFDEQGNPLDVADLNEGDIVYDANGDAYAMTADEPDSFDDGYDDYDEDEIGKSAWNKVTNAASTMRQGAGLMGYAAGSTAKGAIKTGASRVRAAGVDAMQGTRATKIRGHLSNHRGAYGTGLGVLGGAGGAVAYNRSRVGKNYAEEIREELSKALTDSEREDVISKALGQVGALAEEVEIAKAAAEQERALRIEREYTEIAKSYNLPFEDEELGRVLMHAAEYLPVEDQEIIHKAFSAAGEAIFDEYGAVGAGGAVDVYSQVEAAIAGDAQISKAYGGDTAAAMTDYFTANPEAYDQYLMGN